MFYVIVKNGPIAHSVYANLRVYTPIGKFKLGLGPSSRRSIGI